MSNIRVAVRVRPLNEKEKNEGSREIVKVKQNTVSIENVKVLGVPEFVDSRARVREFVFDHCYDCMQGGQGSQPGYATQEQVFQDLGTQVLREAVEGFNACVFAYGQTGTGKTHTMMGQQDDPGLIPRICEELFSRVSDCAAAHVSCRIDLSYFEIYNERVRDLLQPDLLKQNENYSLKVREHPKDGPYVKGLSWHRVKDNLQIQALLEKGNQFRVTAETYMHGHSSRSHAIVTICFTQARLEDNSPSEIVSKIHLVDLAGSERADPSSRPDFRKRLTEGSSINRSLVALGYVIKALAERSLLSWSAEDMGSTQSFSSGGEAPPSSSPANRPRMPFIPYRDSVLTYLLKDSLGGNSKTIMIATITPASQYYSESINTLRYAQRAKTIINKPHVNEDGNVALIRELRREIGRLHEMLATAQKGGHLVSLSDSDDMLAEQLHESEEKAKQLTQNWMCKWTSTHDIMKESDLSIRGLRSRNSSVGVMVDSQLPYLVGMDDDILSTGVVIFHLKEGETLIGTEGGSREPDIGLTGPSILQEHCVIVNSHGDVILHPCNGAVCAVQGLEVLEPTKLSQGDFIMLGGNQVFRFNNPLEAAKLREHRKSQGSLNTLSPPQLSFGGLSRASSYNSLGGDDPNYLSPMSHLSRSYPYNRRHSDVIIYAASDLCRELERRHKSEQERIEQARLDMERLKAEHAQADEQRQLREEEMYAAHEAHRLEIEEEKRRLGQLIDENERARYKAEEELQLARESLAREKEAFQQQLEAEMKKLRELQNLEKQGQVESSGIQTETPSTMTSAVGEDGADDTFMETDEISAALPGKLKDGEVMSVDDQIRTLQQNEFVRRMSYRETEESLAIQQEDIEEQYLMTQETITERERRIKELEEEYKQLDEQHFQEIADQDKSIKELHQREVQLEVYIQENEELLSVKEDIPRPLRSATSEMFLLKPTEQMDEPKFPSKTTSLQDIQGGVDEEVPASPRGPQSSSSCESTNFDTKGKSKTDKLDFDARTLVAKKPPRKITSTAKDVTSRLYKPPEPKFKYVPKQKEAEQKSVRVPRTRPPREPLDTSRLSPDKAVRDSTKNASPSPQRPLSKSASPSPQRPLSKSASPSPQRPLSKTASPSPQRPLSKTASPSPQKPLSKTAGHSPQRPLLKTASPSPQQSLTESASPSQQRPRSKRSSSSPSKDVETKKRTVSPQKDIDTKFKQKAVPKTRDNKEDAKPPQSKSPVKEKKDETEKEEKPSPKSNSGGKVSPERLNVAGPVRMLSPKLKLLSSASSLASVPEAVDEPSNVDLGTVVKKRARRGRSSFDLDDWRSRSAPDSESMAEAYDQYTLQMEAQDDSIRDMRELRFSISADDSEMYIENEPGNTELVEISGKEIGQAIDVDEDILVVYQEEDIAGSVLCDTERICDNEDAPGRDDSDGDQKMSSETEVYDNDSLLGKRDHRDTISDSKDVSNLPAKKLKGEVDYEINEPLDEDYSDDSLDCGSSDSLDEKKGQKLSHSLPAYLMKNDKPMSDDSLNDSLEDQENAEDNQKDNETVGNIVGEIINEDVSPVVGDLMCHELVAQVPHLTTTEVQSVDVYPTSDTVCKSSCTENKDTQYTNDLRNQEVQYKSQDLDSEDFEKVDDSLESKTEPIGVERLSKVIQKPVSFSSTCVDVESELPKSVSQVDDIRTENSDKADNIDQIETDTTGMNENQSEFKRTNKNDDGHKENVDSLVSKSDDRNVTALPESDSSSIPVEMSDQGISQSVSHKISLPNHCNVDTLSMSAVTVHSSLPTEAEDSHPSLPINHTSSPAAGFVTDETDSGIDTLDFNDTRRYEAPDSCDADETLKSETDEPLRKTDTVFHVDDNGNLVQQPRLCNENTVESVGTVTMNGNITDSLAQNAAAHMIALDMISTRSTVIDKVTHLMDGGSVIMDEDAPEEIANESTALANIPMDDSAVHGLPNAAAQETLEQTELSPKEVESNGKVSLPMDADDSAENMSSVKQDSNEVNETRETQDTDITEPFESKVETTETSEQEPICTGSLLQLPSLSSEIESEGRLAVNDGNIIDGSSQNAAAHMIARDMLTAQFPLIDKDAPLMNGEFISMDVNIPVDGANESTALQALANDSVDLSAVPGLPGTLEQETLEEDTAQEDLAQNDCSSAQHACLSKEAMESNKKESLPIDIDDNAENIPTVKQDSDKVAETGEKQDTDITVPLESKDTDTIEQELMNTGNLLQKLGSPDENEVKSEETLAVNGDVTNSSVHNAAAHMIACDMLTAQSAAIDKETPLINGGYITMDVKAPVEDANESTDLQDYANVPMDDSIVQGLPGTDSEQKVSGHKISAQMTDSSQEIVDSNKKESLPMDVEDNAEKLSDVKQDSNKVVEAKEKQDIYSTEPLKSKVGATDTTGQERMDTSDEAVFTTESGSLVHIRSIGVGTSLEYLGPADGEELEVSLSSEESSLDPAEDLHLLQQTLENLQKPQSTGPQLSTARRAARQRAMLRQRQRAGDADDSVGQLSDDSPLSVSRSKPSSRPDSGSRRRRPRSSRSFEKVSKGKDKSSDDYDSSDNDSVYSNDSRTIVTNGLICIEDFENGDALLGRGDDLNSVSSIEGEAEDMFSRHRRKGPGRAPEKLVAHSEFADVDEPGGGRSVGVQTFDHPRRLRSTGSSSVRTELSDLDNSFASADISHLNMVVSPLSLWNSNDRAESGSLSDRNSTSSTGVVRPIGDHEKSFGSTPRSRSRERSVSSSVFLESSSLDKGPTEVWCSSASELRQLPGFNEDLSYIMETEVMVPGASSLDFSEDAQSQFSSLSARSPQESNSNYSPPGCSTPKLSKLSGRVVSISYPESQIERVAGLDECGPVTFEVTIQEARTNIQYNVEKTEYKTYALRSQGPNEERDIADTSQANFTESVASQTQDMYDRHYIETVVRQQSDEEVNEARPVFDKSCTSEKEFKVNDRVKKDSQKDFRKESDHESLHDGGKTKPARRTKILTLQSSGVVETTNYPGSDNEAEEGSKLKPEEGHCLDESDYTSDYGTITSVDGKKGFMSFTSDDSDENDSMLTGPQSVSPRPPQFVQATSPTLQSLGDEEEVTAIVHPPLSVCATEDVVFPNTLAARTSQSSPVQFVSQPLLQNASNKSGEGTQDISNDKNSDEAKTSPIGDNEQDEQETDSSSIVTVKTVNADDAHSNFCSQETLTDTQLALNESTLEQGPEKCSENDPVNTSEDDLYHSLDNASSCSSDYRTPQLSPRESEEENMVSEQVLHVQIPELETVPAGKASLTQGFKDEKEAPIFTSSPKRPNSVRTVSVNTETPPAILQNQPPAVASSNIGPKVPASSELGPAELQRKDLQRKIAKIQHGSRSFSDSAISSDYTDGDSSSLSPRASACFDIEKSVLRHLDSKICTQKEPVYAVSPPQPQQNHDKSPFNDSGNVFDGDANPLGDNVAIAENFDDKPVNANPESIVSVALATKPYPVGRSASLDSLSTIIKVGPSLSNKFKDILKKELDKVNRMDTDDMTPKTKRKVTVDSNQNIVESESEGECEDETLMSSGVGAEHQQLRPLSPGEIGITQGSIEDMFEVLENGNIVPSREIQATACHKAGITGKSTSLSNLEFSGPNRDYLRSFSETNIDDFDEENNISSNSNDSITFVFVRKYPDEENKVNHHDDEYEKGEIQPEHESACNISGRGHPSPNSTGTVISELIRSRSASGEICSREDADEKEENDAVMSRSNSESSVKMNKKFSEEAKHLGDDQCSTHSASEEIVNIIMKGDSNQGSCDLTSATQIDSPTSYTDTSDGRDKRWYKEEDSSPLRHKFGIDESVLPISERSQSADNLPKRVARFNCLHRSRSTGMIDVGVVDDQESESGIFPPAVVYVDEDSTEASASLRTMSEGRTDNLSPSDVCGSYSNRTSADLEIDTSTSEDHSSAVIRSVVSNASSLASSVEDFREEIIINYRCNDNSKQRHGSSRLPSSVSSEGDQQLDDEEHIREVLRTVEKFILPQRVLVDRGVSTETEEVTKSVSRGIQTSRENISVQTDNAATALLRPDQIILPALAAPFRAQSMESFGLGNAPEARELSDGAQNWCTLGQLMAETTHLLKRINEKLPDLDRSSICSSEESQSIIQQWNEMKIQTGTSLQDLNTIGLQTDDNDEITYVDKPEMCTGFTQVDEDFKIQSLCPSDTVLSDIIPAPSETIPCHISIQTDETTPNLPFIDTDEMAVQTEDSFDHSDDMLISLLPRWNVQAPTAELQQASETNPTRSKSSKESEDLNNSGPPVTEDQFTPVIAANLNQSPDRKNAKFIPQVKAQLGLDEPVSSQSNNMQKQKPGNGEQGKSAPVVSDFMLPDSKEIEELRKEHALLMENLRKASDQRKNRKEEIKARKKPKKDEGDFEIKVPATDIVSPNSTHDTSQPTKSSSPTDMVQINIQVDPTAGVQVQNKTYKSQPEDGSETRANITEETGPGLTRSHSWHMNANEMMAVSDERLESSGSRSRSASGISEASSASSLSSEVAKAFANPDVNLQAILPTSTRPALSPKFISEDILLNSSQGTTTPVEEVIVPDIYNREQTLPSLEKCTEKEQPCLPGGAQFKSEGIPLKDDDNESTTNSSQGTTTPVEEVIIPETYNREETLPSLLQGGSKKEKPGLTDSGKGIKDNNQSSNNSSQAKTTPVEEVSVPETFNREKTLPILSQGGSKKEKTDLAHSGKSPFLPDKMTPGKDKTTQKEDSSAKSHNSKGRMVPDYINSVPEEDNISPVEKNPDDNRSTPADDQYPDYTDAPSEIQVSSPKKGQTPPRFGHTDDETQVSISFADDCTQTDPSSMSEPDDNNDKPHEPTPKEDEKDEITLTASPDKHDPKDSLPAELEELQKERHHIMELLGMQYLPPSLTVELLEAKMNYCIGQTDLLLDNLEEGFPEDESKKPLTPEQKNIKDYISKYRSDLKKSKEDIKECQEQLKNSKNDVPRGRGRGRAPNRRRDLMNRQRQAEVDAFMLERMREQNDYEKSRLGTPHKGNTPLRGNTPLYGNSPDVTPRSERSRSSSPSYSPGYMTPREHREHLVDLRRQFIRDVAEEEEQHSRSCSPSIPHTEAPPRLPRTRTTSESSTGFNPHPVPLSSQSSVHSQSSPKDRRSPSRQSEPDHRPSVLSTPLEEMLRRSSFSSTSSQRVFRKYLASLGKYTRSRSDLSPSPRGSAYRSCSPVARQQDPLSLNLSGVHDDDHTYSPYSAYAREHILPSERPHGGVLRGTYELYNSAAQDRSDSSSVLSFGSDTHSDTGRPLDEETVQRLRPINAGDIKTRMGRHKR